MATEAETKEPISERAVTATDNSSILHETANDEALHPVAVGLLDISKGEILDESHIDVQCSSKETAVKYVKIVSQELENEGSLTSSGNHIEAKDEVIAENERITDESTSHDGLQHRNQDNNNVDAQATKFDMLEASEAQSEHNEGEAQVVTDMEKFERVNEDKHIKIEAKTGILNDESTNDIDSISGAEPSEKESTKDPPEIMIKDLGTAEGDDLESSIDAVPEDPVAKKLEGGENKHVKIEAENGNCSDDRTNVIDSIPMADPSEKQNTQEPLEEMAKEDTKPAKDESEQGKLETDLDGVSEEPEEEKLEKATEDMDAKIREETRICNDERTNAVDSISAAEPSKEENRQEPLGVTTKEDLEPAEDAPEIGELQTPLDAVPEEPEASMLPHPISHGINEKHETETTREEEVVVNIEETSHEDEKKYEPIEKVASELPPEYQNAMTKSRTEAVTANETNEKNADDKVGDLPIARGIITETIGGGEMHEIAASEETIHASDDNIEQIPRETEPEILDKISEMVSENQSCEEVADAETTNFISGDGATLEKEIDPLCTSKASMEENTENTIYTEDTNNIDSISANEDEAQRGPDIEKLERVNEDNNIKIESENGIFNYESTNDIDSISDAEPSEKENKKEPLEMVIENLEPAEVDKLESPLDAVPQEPEAVKLEKLNEDNHDKIEAETGRLNNGSTNDIDSISIEEPSEKRNTQDPLEETATEDLEPEKEQPEHGELERTIDAVPDETENEKLERENEDKNVKVEAETGIYDNADSISVTESSDKENRQEPLEITGKEDPEPLEEVPEQGKLESPLDAVHEEAEASMLPQDGPESCRLKRKEEKETTRKEELIMNGEESSPQDEQIYQQIEEAVFNLLPEYQNMKISDQGEKTEPANEESESLNEIDVVKRTIQEEDNKHEETTNSACEEPNQNDSNMNTRSDEFRNDIETVNKESESSNEHHTVEGTKYEGREIHEDSINSISKELGQNNDKDVTLIKPETEPDSERASQLSQKHCNDAIADSETMNRDVVTLEEIKCMDKEIDGFSTSHASEEDNTGAATGPTEAIEQIPTANNENEGCDGNMVGERELTIEKEIYEKPEENKSVESEATPGMSFHEEEKATDKLDDSNELQQGKESSAAVKESAADETLISALQEEKWEDKLENPSSEVSWETIGAQESTHPQDVEKKDPPEKHEECFATKDEAEHILVQAVVGMDTEDPTSIAEGSNAEYIHDVVSGKAEETPNSACEEQTQETINASIGVEANGQGKELIEKHEPVSNSVPEDKNQEIVRGKESSMIENSTSNCILKDMISETVEANDDKVNVIDEASLNKYFDDHPETHGEVGQKNGEGPNSDMEDQTHPATSTEEKFEVDVSEEKKETQQLKIIPESLVEDKCQKETSESDAIKINNSTDDEDPKTMIPGVVDLDEDAKTAKENDEANTNTDKGDSSDEHTLIVPTLTDQVGEHEDASKTESGEQMYQAINDKGNVEVEIHKEMADSEELENITESVPNDYNQGGLSEPKSIDNSAHNDNLDKAIPETVDHNDDTETAKVEDGDVLEKDIAYVSDTHELLKKPSYDVVDEKHEDADQLSNNEDNKEAIVQEEKEILETNLELGPEDQSQDAISETENAKLQKAPNLDKDAKCSDVITENASDETSESKLEETMVGNNYELESDDKLESTNKVGMEEVSREEKTVDIVETSLSTVNTNCAEVISENQIEGNDGATSNADSENISCEDTQKFEEAIPEVADRDQNKERCDGDDNTKNGTTIEVVKVSEVVQNFQPLLKIEAENQISKDASQVMKVAGAYECQDYEENGECKENKNTSHMTEKCVSKGNEEAKNEILDAVTSKPFNEADGNLQGGHGEQEIQEDNRTRDGVPNEEVDSKPKIKESEDGKKEIITISDINLPDIPASKEEAGQVENAHENAGDSSHEEHIHESITPSEVENEQAVDSSYGEQIHERISPSEVENSCDKAVDSSYEEQVPESISLSEDANPEPPIKETATEDHEGDHASMNNEQEHKELSGKGVCENDKISEEDRTDDGEAFRSSLLAQEVEGGEEHKADELISEQKTEAFEPEQNQEVFNACPGVLSNKFDEPNATEVECLAEETAKREDETNSTGEKAKNADLVSQMDMETMNDLHADEASLDKNLQDASVVVPEEKILSTPEDNSTGVRAISNNENKEKQDVQTSLQKEEQEDKPQEKENEMQTDESSNTSEINENESLKGKETIENDSEKGKLDDGEPEISPHVVLEDLQTATGTEDVPESETLKQITEDNSEENSLKDRDMKLVASEIELEPRNQINKSFCTSEEASPVEEGLVDDVAQVDLQNEGSHCKTDGDLSIARELVEESIDMEGQGHHLHRESAEIEAHEKTEESDSIVTQNEETEGSELLNIKLQEDAKEPVQLEESSNTLVGSQDNGNGVENIEKNVVSEEDAIEAAYEHTQVDETETKKNNEADTDTFLNVEVKEYNHQSSNQSITKIDAPENQGTSPIIASPAEETKKEVANKFSKISDYWPVGYSEEASDVNAVDTELPDEMRSIAEQPSAVEKFTFTSADSTAASEIDVKADESYVVKASGLDPIYKEGREELKEVSDSVPKEDMDENIGSANEHTEDKENPCEKSVMQEPQVNQPEVVAEAKEPTDKASCKVELDNLQEEKQQTGLGELPVSHFLMKYILQEEDDTLKGAGDEENDDVTNMQNEGDEQNDVEIPKQEETRIPLSNVQLTEETSIPKDNVCSEKIQDSSELVQAEESYDVKKTSEITVVKHDTNPQSTLDKSMPGLEVTEDRKDEVVTPLSQTSTHIATDDGLELISTEKSISEIIVESEEHGMEHDLVQDEKIQATVVEETVTEKEIQKNNKILETDADVSIFGKAKEDDILQKEVGKESKERSRDFENVEDSCAESYWQSTMNKDKDGDILATKSEDKKVECGEEEKDVGHQVQILNNDSNEELKLSESQNNEQSDLVTGSNVHAPKTDEKFMKDEKSPVSLDREQVVERTNAKVDENKTEEEHQPDNSGYNATTVETRDAELKPTQKCDQTSKSFESSTIDDHKLGETSELQSKVIKVESGEKQQNVMIDQNQVQMKNGSSKEMKPSESQKVQQSDVAIESTVQGENQTVQTTDTKVDEGKTDDEKDQKEEEDECNPEEYGHDETTNVEDRDAELKPTPKKSHGIYSKVKHSIAKVKKAITGKSSNSKALSAK